MFEHWGEFYLLVGSAAAALDRRLVLRSNPRGHPCRARGGRLGLLDGPALGGERRRSGHQRHPAGQHPQ